MPRQNRVKNDLSGERFGRLTVTGVAESTVEPSGKAVRMWRCRCDCGNEITVAGHSLKKGNTKSCGCYKKEKAATSMKKHGKSKDRLYRIWSSMKSRCQNKKLSTYRYYGGRGVTVCDEWRTFEAFYEWAMANDYKDGLTIDRKDNNGNYEPSNCRWATVKQQSNNRRSNHYITHDGKTMSLTDWAEEKRIPRRTLQNRINTLKWSAKKALTTPVQGGNS